MLVKLPQVKHVFVAEDQTQGEEVPCYLREVSVRGSLVFVT